MTRDSVALPVLMYHSVGSAMPPGLEHLSVPAALVREQLSALRENGYELLGLTEALAASVQQRQVVAVTFDDGFVDFVEHAMDALRDVQAEATVYVPSRAMGAIATWLPGDSAPPRIMDTLQIAEVAAAGVEVGSHGAEHVPMDVLPRRTSVSYLRESRERLEQVTGSSVRSFCYPHGYHSRGLRDEVKLVGYQNACAIGHRRHPSAGDPYAVQRLLIGPSHEPAAVLRMAQVGVAGLVPELKRLATPPWRLARWVALRTLGRSWT